MTDATSSHSDGHGHDDDDDRKKHHTAAVAAAEPIAALSTPLETGTAEFTKAANKAHPIRNTLAVLFAPVALIGVAEQVMAKPVTTAATAIATTVSNLAQSAWQKWGPK